MILRDLLMPPVVKSGLAIPRVQVSSQPRPLGPGLDDQERRGRASRYLCSREAEDPGPRSRARH